MFGRRVSKTCFNLSLMLVAIGAFCFLIYNLATGEPPLSFDLWGLQYSRWWDLLLVPIFVFMQGVTLALLENRAEYTKEKSALWIPFYCAIFVYLAMSPSLLEFKLLDKAFASASLPMIGLLLAALDPDKSDAVKKMVLVFFGTISAISFGMAIAEGTLFSIIFFLALSLGAITLCAIGYWLISWLKEAFFLARIMPIKEVFSEIPRPTLSWLLAKEPESLQEKEGQEEQD